jgi:hypothetical protein
LFSDIIEVHRAAIDNSLDQYNAISPRNPLSCCEMYLIVISSYDSGTPIYVLRSDQRLVGRVIKRFRVKDRDPTSALAGHLRCSTLERPRHKRDLFQEISLQSQVGELPLICILLHTSPQ